jgi:hypothetical protein
MSYQNVREALDELHREIQRLEPAITHVETAQQVTQIMSTLPQHYLVMLEEVKKHDLEHKQELLDRYNTDVSRIREQNVQLHNSTTSLQQATVQTLADLGTKHLELINELRINDERYKIDLVRLFSHETAAILDENVKLQNTTAEIQNQVILEQVALRNLKDTIKSFHDRVEQINFPERLDGLGANITGLMATIQAIQRRLDVVERNLSDRIKDISDYQKETHTAIQNQLQESITGLQNTMDLALKRQQGLIYTTWVLIIIGIVLSLLK